MENNLHGLCKLIENDLYGLCKLMENYLHGLCKLMVNVLHELCKLMESDMFSVWTNLALQCHIHANAKVSHFYVTRNFDSEPF
jgi:hypothetical protein